MTRKDIHNIGGKIWVTGQYYSISEFFLKGKEKVYVHIKKKDLESYTSKCQQ